MRRMVCLILVLSTCAGIAAAQPVPSDDAAIRQFDQNIHAADLAGWMKLLAAEPNHEGVLNEGIGG